MVSIKYAAVLGLYPFLFLLYVRRHFARMIIPEHSMKLAIALPWWQVVAILVGFPLLYLANNFTPWSRGLFVKRDHGYYLPVFGSILLLHWLSVALVMVFLAQAGGGLKDIGLDLSASEAAVMLGIFIVLATVFVLFRQTRPTTYLFRIPADMPPLLPVTLGERSFWMLASATAGICEELVYRGFGLCVLRGNGVPAWLAVVLVSFSFVLIHGLWGLRRWRQYFIVGVLYSGLFLWVQSLTPGIWIHTLWDMVFIFAG
jgi:membrane protease YdiL (CAAX protease family)